MKAAVVPKYGPPSVLEVREIEKPEPREGEVLVKIEAASVNAADWHIIRGEPRLMRLGFGFGRPKIKAAGVDAAGVVEAVGPGVSEFRPGDAVFGELAGHKLGAFAEYVSAPATAFTRKPEAVSFEDAACLPVAGQTALQALRDHGELREGQRVLVVGASGCVGIFAVQLARILGAASVTAVCSERKVEMVRSLGADRVVNYEREDVTRTGETWDVIVDAGAFRSIFEYTGSMTPTGIYVLVGGEMKRTWQTMLRGGLRSRKNGRRYRGFVAKANRADQEYLAEHVATGDLRVVIGARFPLDQAAQAVSTMEEGRAIGKVVITP